MNADGSGQTRLTNNPGLDYFSGWGRAPLVTADFTANITTGIAPLPVQFNDTSAVVNPTDWSWDFGDGNVTNATRQNPVHTYISAGNFTVSLNASNAAGSNLTTKAKYIKVTSGLAPTPTKIGVFRNSTRQWLLDYNGNGIWDGAPTDKVYKYILSTDTPVSGKWS
jgi:PKD repeat protein